MQEIQEDHAMDIAGPSRWPAEASTSTWEIEEVEQDPKKPAARPPPHPPGITNHSSDADDVYVAVGKSSSSMVALSWALNHLAKPYSSVYLVHVFPVAHSIPTPLGMLPKYQASPQQVDTYMDKERARRREMLQKYLDACSNFKVHVDIFLIESDQIANAIIELIPVLNVRTLVVGTSKCNLRKLNKGSTKAGLIQKKAPINCEVRIICDGKEVIPAEQTAILRVNTKSKSDRSASPSTPDKKWHKEQRDKNKIPNCLRCFSFCLKLV